MTMERVERCCEDQQVHTDTWKEKVNNGTFKAWGIRTTPDTLFPDCLLTPGDISSLHTVWPQALVTQFEPYVTWFWPLLMYENRTSLLKPDGSSPLLSGRNATGAWDTVQCFRGTVKHEGPRVYYLCSLSRRQIQILSPGSALGCHQQQRENPDYFPWQHPITGIQVSKILGFREKRKATDPNKGTTQSLGQGPPIPLNCSWNLEGNFPT